MRNLGWGRSTLPQIPICGRNDIGRFQIEVVLERPAKGNTLDYKHDTDGAALGQPL